MTTRSPRHVQLLQALLAFVIITLAFPAAASHYYLADLDNFSRSSLDRMRGEGIQTTEHFLKATLTPEDRKKLSAKTGQRLSDVTSFAKECELLQIDGVGPKMVKLFIASGVTGVDDLASRDSATLLMRLEVVNKEDKVMEQLPSEGFVYKWIKAASLAKYRVK